MSTPFPVPLTADMMAVAIVAAARIYGDSPEKTLSGGGSQRRALPPALCAVSNQTGQSIKKLCRMTGLYASNLTVAQRHATPRFNDAVAAAGHELLKLTLKQSAALTNPHRAPLVFQRPEPPSPLTMTGRVLKLVAEQPISAPNMAIRLGTNEREIITALSILKHQGRVEPGEASEQGERWRAWQVVAEQVAA